jgi:flagellar protein FliO/FliZ
MDVIGPERLLTLGVFLGALVVLWALVMRHRGPLRDRMSRQRRLELVERLPLSPADQALILRVDGRDFLMLRAKGAAPVLHPLDPVQGGAE